MRIKKEANIFLGVPGENVKRDGDINNAYLMQIQEQGVPGHIPPRPVLKKVAEKYKSIIDRELLNYMITGKESILDSLCLFLEGKAKEYILDKENLTPNAPSTIWRKSIKTYKMVKLKNGKKVKRATKIKKLSDTPLVDTGALVGSIKCWREEE